MSRNDITGDSLRTKPTSDHYRDNFERIFGKKKKDEPQSIQDVHQVQPEQVEETGVHDQRQEL